MDSFDRLLEAARELLQSRYQDGEVDAVALSRFASVVEGLDPTITHRGHRLLIADENSETVFPRRGCLDCNVWIDPVRLKHP